MHTEGNHEEKMMEYKEYKEYKGRDKEESAENRHHPYDIHQIHKSSSSSSSSSHQMEDHIEGGAASFKKMSVHLRSSSKIRPAPQHFDISKLDYDLESMTQWVYNIVFKDDIKNDEDAAMRICIASFGTFVHSHLTLSILYTLYSILHALYDYYYYYYYYYTK